MYFDLLGDLPVDVLQAAARRAVLAHRWPNLPPAGAIRAEALALVQPRTLGPVAWALALAAVRRYGRRRESEGLASLPADAALALRCFGWRVLCDATDDRLGLAEHQFLERYEALIGTVRHEAALPRPVRAVAEGIGQLPGVVLPKALTDR